MAKPSSPDPGPADVADFEKAQEAEYTEYVATEPINVDGVRAFNVGDPVPKSHVDRGVVSDEQVARRNTKAGETALNPEA